ncbi:HAMP domain-containing histidine kinase [Glutamicibacter sp. MNS18]|uniref:HAMP domain-containing sensor histidine kinase n=1 Tax=Glutamicibacter sp. MNS18 TaxID=2989817 RepID=UPI00223678D8|nr:HAMP domain-containing sensor histidine kinase [Glutamicibacter sp. MNS18]MCW4464918.1 HAMP domain-containing histidine kinase [Glutamicibacter sp. MNS18]
MRLRVLGVLGALLAILVAVLCVVLLQSVSRAATQDLQFSRLDSLNRFVQLAMEAEAESDHDRLLTEMRSYSRLFGEGIVVRVGNEVLDTGELDATDPAVARALRNAGVNLAHTELPTVNPFGTGSELLSRPFGNSSQVLGAVVLEVNPQTARQKVLAGWLAVVGTALVATVILVGLAWWVTTWVLRPIHRLNVAVQEFASTGTPKRLPEDGPPELRQLQRSFSSMSAVVTESLEAQRELIAETSHQLRNPIAALRLRVDLLKLKLGNSAPEAIEAVEHELGSVERLLASVLRLASAEHRASERAAHQDAGTGLETYATIDPVEVLTEEFDRVCSRARALDTPLRMKVADGADLRLSCNGFELAQMVGELLANALKYAHGAPVDLALENRDGQVLITVRDRGPGLGPEELKNAGRRFWRGSEHRSIEGTGLGLTIVGRLAEANRGTLELAAAAGGGLLATLRFPAADSSPEPKGQA